MIKKAITLAVVIVMSIIVAYILYKEKSSSSIPADVRDIYVNISK